MKYMSRQHDLRADCSAKTPAEEVCCYRNRLLDLACDILTDLGHADRLRSKEHEKPRLFWAGLPTV